MKSNVRIHVLNEKETEKRSTNISSIAKKIVGNVMKFIFASIFLAAVAYALYFLGILVYGVFFNKEPNQKIEENQVNTEQKELKSNHETIVSGLAKKYNAITNWDKDVKYTIQAQEKLIQNKPVIFTTTLEEIFNGGGKTYVRFSFQDPLYEEIFRYYSNAHDNVVDKFKYVLELECDKKTVDKIILEQKSEDNIAYKGIYVVVAKVNNVSKPTIALKGEITSIEDEEIEITPEPSDFLVIRGVCVDIVGVKGN